MAYRVRDHYATFGEVKTSHLTYFRLRSLSNLDPAACFVWSVEGDDIRGAFLQVPDHYPVCAPHRRLLDRLERGETVEQDGWQLPRSAAAQVTANTRVRVDGAGRITPAPKGRS